MKQLADLKHAISEPNVRVYVWTIVGRICGSPSSKPHDAYPYTECGVFAEVGKTQFKQMLSALPSTTQVAFRVDPDTKNVFVKVDTD